MWSLRTNLRRYTIRGEGGLPLNPTEENSSSISLNDDGTLTVFSEVVDVQFLDRRRPRRCRF